MKYIPALFFFCLLATSLIAQTNETDIRYYTWKGKKTTPQKGFVVLKSGKRLEGEISLKGSPENVEEVSYAGDGKEFDLPVASLSSYGLYVPSQTGAKTNPVFGAVNDNAEALYEWRDLGEVMGKKKESTKPRSGYVVLLDGSIVEGELQIKKTDGIIDQFEVKLTKGKEKYEMSQVARYGLSMTIDELTNGGKRTYNEPGRNFHGGSILQKDGAKLVGFLRFNDATTSETGRIYSGLIFTKNQNEPVRNISASKVTSVTQEILGKEVFYSPSGDGFLSDNIEDQPKSGKDITRSYLRGSVTTLDGKTINGEVAQIKRKFYATGINFKDDSNFITTYSSENIMSFTQELEGKMIKYMKVESAFVPEEYNGATFLLYHNPYPSTVNERATNTAIGLASTAAGIGSQALMENASGDKELAQENMANLQRISTDSLTLLRDMVVELSSDENSVTANLSDAEKKRMLAMLGSIELEVQRRNIPNAGIKIYYDEWILTNKSSNEKFVLYKQDYKDIIEPILMGCFTYLSLEKSQQRDFLDWDNLHEALVMLDDCY